MIQLYYTGASTPSSAQIFPNKSLGGYVAATTIDNGSLNNLFPVITKTSILQNKRVVRLLALKNVSGGILSIRIWTKSEKFSKIRIAAVEPFVDTKGQLMFELLDNENAIPFQASLSSCEGEANSITIEIIHNQTVGLWIERELNLDQFTDLDKGISPDLKDQDAVKTYLDELSATTVEEKDEIEIIFDAQIITTTTTIQV